MQHVSRKKNCALGAWNPLETGHPKRMKQNTSTPHTAAAAAASNAFVPGDGGSSTALHAEPHARQVTRDDASRAGSKLRCNPDRTPKQTDPRSRRPPPRARLWDRGRNLVY
jgi:hypothetical protein